MQTLQAAIDIMCEARDVVENNLDIDATDCCVVFKSRDGHQKFELGSSSSMLTPTC